MGDRMMYTPNKIDNVNTSVDSHYWLKSLDTSVLLNFLD